eukprot:sb/3462964/
MYLDTVDTTKFQLFHTTSISSFLLTALPTQEINPTTITCHFEGTNEPTLTWFSGSTALTAASDADAFTIDDGSWSDSAITSTLTVDKAKVTDVVEVTCKVTFADDSITDSGLETSTAIHYREISSKTGKTYATGAEVILTCTLSYGASGTGPNSATWSGLDGFTVDTDYTIDAGTNNNDGTRSTTLTFASTDDGKFAGTYACSFTYTSTTQGVADTVFSDTVQVIVRSATVDKETQMVHTNAGFQITCTSVGDETPVSASWTFGGSPLVHDQGGFSLTFTADTKKAVLDKSSPATSDDGEYKCEFQFSEGDGASATSTITVALLAVEQPAAYYGAEGGDLFMKCNMKNDAKVDIFWFKDNTLMTNAADETFLGGVVSSTYSISGLVPATHEGTWKCSLSNDPAVTTEVSTTNVVLSVLSFTKQPSGKIYVSNAVEFNLTCVSEYASGITAAVTWDQTGAETTQVDSSKFTSAVSDDGNSWNSVLTMTMSSSLVAVQFSCKYTFSGDAVGTDESLTSTGAQMYLESLDGPDESSTYLKTGSAFEITCKAFGGSTTTISWTFKGVAYTEGVQAGSVFDSDTNSITSVVKIDSVAEANEGVYECIHSGDPTHLKESVELSVYGPDCGFQNEDSWMIG